MTAGAARSWLPGPRGVVTTFLAVYLVGLGCVLLNPSADVPSGSLGFVIDAGGALRVPAQLLVPERVEFVANALVIVPAAATSAWLWPRHSWTTWTAYGYVGALGVEAVQGLLLPDRSATYVDVVSNTLGALLGAVVVQLGRGWFAPPTEPRSDGAAGP